MDDAPEKIWTCNRSNEKEMGLFVTTPSQVEYIRADLVPGWQPIETAPKDKGILLTDGDNLACLGCWHDGTWVFWEGDCDDESVFLPESPRRDVSVELNGWVPPYGPTHWMPLPAPPKGGE